MSASILSKTETALVALLQEMQRRSQLLAPCTIGPGHTADKMTAPMLVAEVKQVNRLQPRVPLFECDVHLYVVTQLDDETEDIHYQRVSVILAYLELQPEILFEVNDSDTRPQQDYRVSGYVLTEQETARVDRRFITSLRLSWNCS
jgi:hypothetical protein